MTGSYNVLSSSAERNTTSGTVGLQCTQREINSHFELLHGLNLEGQQV
ncbi:hypothetical protein SAMN05443574_1365 [Haloarcula vallismortis]|uniref:Uncharacterized protein n=1 Tax=Haloarcula vallismortis TaxID=28442 RepID=A0A1H3B228_HALVA|nr:hypothetical protein SAMN05443574_1365 [Haloarcula vallismortis]